MYLYSYTTIKGFFSGLPSKEGRSGAFAAKPLNLSILFTQFSILLEMPPPNHKKAP
jgi:hypothetical protein